MTSPDLTDALEEAIAKVLKEHDSMGDGTDRCVSCGYIEGGRFYDHWAQKVIELVQYHRANRGLDE